MGEEKGRRPAARDGEVIDLLMDLGLDEKASRILAYLSRVREGESGALRRSCHLRQPDVSVATKLLRERGWVLTEERRKGKGRPVHVYRLNVEFTAILDALEADMRAGIEGELGKIERLRSLLLASPDGDSFRRRADDRAPRLLERPTADAVEAGKPPEVELP